MMQSQILPALGAETALAETVKFAAHQAEIALDRVGALPWLVTASILASQQAAALALRAVGDDIPEQIGATEMLLRAASASRLPAPFTLPLTASDRRDFDVLVEARNATMHPRGRVWHVTARTLGRGLPVVCRAIRHLVLVQPPVPDLVGAGQAKEIENALGAIDALADFLGGQT
ncbi:MAG: hypothetical protein AAGJ84_06440 [Pseudomonadota bacterium]